MYAKSKHFTIEKLYIGVDWNLEWDCVSLEVLTTTNFCTEGTLYKKDLYYLSKIIKPTKKTKNIQYKPIIWSEIDDIFGDFKLVLYYIPDPYHMLL